MWSLAFFDIEHTFELKKLNCSLAQCINSTAVCNLLQGLRSNLIRLEVSQRAPPIATISA